ncbi:glycine betaine ABC transporter substrate-binding protein [Rhodosalinus sp. FB01]|uniref:ABC transporter substrate-binding protein n=1 Tax=Rhodosalinus sp. FB01 TaxID=3239194 RepID=UPI003524D5FA
MMRGVAAFCLVAALTLSACARTPVVVASKNTVQDRVLAEMMALTLEARGLSVERRIGLGDSADVFQALRAGSVDVYPEYSGTALALLDVPPEVDPDAMRARLVEPFAALGLEFLAPFGVESRFVPVTRRALAQRAELAGVSSLAPIAGELRLGVSRSFAERPRDGLAGFVELFGLDFRDVVVVPDERREGLYQMLIDERIDVMIGFSTDPQIFDFGLAPLSVDRPFFPAYDAAPLTSTAALSRHPALPDALAPLAGAVDAPTLRELVRQVQVTGRTPRAVAAIALARLGIVEGSAATPPEIPLAIAVNPEELGSGPANRALEAVRTAMPGRAVALAPANRPLSALAGGEARMAVVPAAAHFRLTPDGAIREEGVEAIGVVGRSVLYAIAQDDGPARLGDARVVATGPEGSPSHLIASVLTRHGEGDLTLAPQADSGAASIGSAIARGAAEAGLVIASRQRGDVVRLLRQSPGLRLVDASAWWQGPTRIALPFLGEATLRPESHPGLDRAVSVLSMQTVITGPAPPGTAGLGRQGPISFDTRVQPLTDTTVRAIDRALGTRVDVGASLRAAPALVPRPPEARTARNPRPDQALLTAGIFAYLGLIGWLLLRRRGTPPNSRSPDRSTPAAAAPRAASSDHSQNQET